MMVYVLDMNGQPLMPTHNGAKVRVLLKQKRAKVISKCPFTIKLLYESTNFTQSLTLGVDTGSKYVGSAVINDVTSESIYESQTELRDDVKSRMDRRRQFRRVRRNKLRYRPVKFNNRRASKRKNRYTPTLISKFQGHKREIEFIKSILPIKDVILEVGEFDPQLLQDPTLAYRKWGYAKGELYQQENFKQAAKARDGHKCQCCGKKNCRLEVHHLLPRSRGGSDKLANLLTLCTDCHSLAHSSEEQLLAFQKKFGKKAKSTLRYATQMNVLRHMLQREYPEAELTYGFHTKEMRRVFGLEKSHMIDACCIASSGVLFKNETSNKYKKKCVPKGNYVRTNTTNGKHVIIPKGKIAGFRRYDKVLYNNKEYFIAGRRSIGKVYLIDIDNNRVQVDRIKRTTGEKYVSKAEIKVSLVKKVASAKTCLCTISK
jgi:5-methylcytosine-specific restriction endonuclease McrA